jgi:hypothetical protein
MIDQNGFQIPTASPTAQPGQPSLPPAPLKPKHQMLVIGLVTFALVTLTALSIYGMVSSSQARSALNHAREKAYQAGQQDQKAEDEERFRIASQSPYRSYSAPGIYGGFEIKFPKNWSGHVVENEGGSPQVQLTLHPNFVKQVANQDNAYAARVQLSRTNHDQIVKQRQNEVKAGRMKQQSVSVAGIPSTRFEGKFDNKHDGVTVLVPVRDKTVIISTDDKKYLPEFDQILAQSKIVP